MLDDIEPVSGGAVQDGGGQAGGREEGGREGGGWQLSSRGDINQVDMQPPPPSPHTRLQHKIDFPHVAAPGLSLADTNFGETQHTPTCFYQADYQVMRGTGG